jgi:hypothetical protein
LIRILFAGAIICFLSATSAGAVSYVIELYDGSEYRVSRYWQERDEIWFDSCGGAYGVPQQDIKSIRKESDHRRLRTLEPDPCGPTQGPPLDTAKDEPTAADSTKDKPKPPVLEKYGKELTAFVKKLDQLEGLSMVTPAGYLYIRADNHQAYKDAVTGFSMNSADYPFQILDPKRMITIPIRNITAPPGWPKGEPTSTYTWIEQTWPKAYG